LDILHEHALKVFQTVDRSFAEINEVLRGMPDASILGNEGPIHERLKQIVEVMPQLQGIAIVDRNGHPLVSSNVAPVPHTIDVTDRDYFQAQLKPGAGTFVSSIHTPRMGGLTSHFFTLSHRRLATDGSTNTFNGVIAIAVLPNYFEDFYARMRSP